MYTLEKQVLNDMTLALPLSLKSAVKKEDFETICKSFGLCFSEIKTKNIFFVVKKIRRYGDELNFIGCGKVQFVFQDFKLKEINASVLFTGENKNKHPYVEQKMFVEKYFHSRDKVIELLKETRNIKQDLNNMQDGIYFDKEKGEFEYDLMNLVKDINALKEKEIHIKKVLSTLFYLSSIGDYVLNLNIDTLYHRDSLTITNRNNARGMLSGIKKLKSLSFRRTKDDKWHVSSVSVSNKGINSNYVIEDDIKAHHDDLSFSFWPFNLSILGVDEMKEIEFKRTKIIFKDKIEPEISKVILPKVFGCFGFKRVIKADENVGEQFRMQQKTEYSDDVYALLCYLKEMKKTLFVDIGEEHLKEEEFKMLMELNINNEEMDHIKNVLLLVKEIYKLCEIKVSYLINDSEKEIKNPVEFIGRWTTDVEGIVNKLS